MPRDAAAELLTAVRRVESSPERQRVDVLREVFADPLCFRTRKRAHQDYYAMPCGDSADMEALENLTIRGCTEAHPQGEGPSRSEWGPLFPCECESFLYTFNG